jgi:hypothetical protein
VALKELYERYLAEEAAIRIPNVSIADRGWFHLCVLQAAVAWSRHPKATFRIGRGKHFFVLHFEGPIETKPTVLFSFRSAVETGEYIFSSFSPAKLPQGLTPPARANLTRLRELYEAALPQSFVDDGMVTVVVKKQSQIDFLPIVDEARRVLDDGNQEFAPVDLSQVALPTEKAVLFVGKTSVTPSPKRRIRQAPQPAIRQEVHFDDDTEEVDRGNFLASQPHRSDDDDAESEAEKPERPAKKSAAKTKPAKPPARVAAKPAKSTKPAKAAPAAKKASKPAKSGKNGARPRDRRAG